MKILFFSPNSNILEHSIPETVLIRELTKKGKNQVIRIYCDSLFNSFCTSMESEGLNFNDKDSIKNKICKKCRGLSKILNGLKNVKGLPVSMFLNNSNKEQINAYLEKLNYENYNFESDDFLKKDLKKKALYETILKFKIKNLNLSKDQFNYYKNKLKTSLYSYHSAVGIAKKIDFEIVVVYSPQYEINNFFCEGLNSVKTFKTYFIEGSENVYLKHSGLRIWDWNNNKLVSPVKKYWDDLKLKSYPSFSEFMVRKHVNELHKASSVHVYSSKKTRKFNFRNGFSTKNFKKTFLLCSSSTDESFAAFVIGAFPSKKYESKVFKDQIDWIIHTIEFFKKRQEFALIIRIHPREYSNKREGIISQNFYNLKAILDQVDSKNIYINYPDERISLYNLFEVIDVTLISWSLTAIESLLSNIPVIVYDNDLTNYPDELVHTGKTKSDYLKNIENLMSNDYKENLQLKSFKWLQVNHYANNVYIKNRKLFMSIILLNKALMKLGFYLFIKYSIKISFLFLTFNLFSQKRIKKLFENKSDNLLDTI